MDLEQFDFSPTLQALLTELWDETRTIRLRACKSPIGPDADAVVPADIVECDFPGYAPVVNPAWIPELIDDPDYAEAYSDNCTFEAGEIVTPQLITALYLTMQPAAGAETIRSLFVLPAPIVVGQSGQRFTRRVRMYAAADGM